MFLRNCSLRKKSHVCFPGEVFSQQTWIMAWPALIDGVGKPATVYIHYTWACCQWLLRDLHCIGERLCAWHLPVTPFALLLYTGNFFQVPKDTFGSNKIHHHKVSLLLFFCCLIFLSLFSFSVYFLLSKVVTPLDCQN